MAAVFDKPMAAIDDRVTMVCDTLARELAVLFLCRGRLAAAGVSALPWLI